MSAELFDGESAGALALPAVDILPARPTRKGKGGQAEPSAPPLLEASDEGWSTPAPHVPVNPWTGAPADPAAAGYPPPSTTDVATAVATAGPVQVPAPAPDQVPVPLPAQLAAPDLMSVPPAPQVAVEADAGPKKFLGMTVRRQKKPAPAQDAPLDVAPETPTMQAVPGQPVMAGQPAPQDAEAQPPAPTSAYEAVVAPVAAWPTDVGVPAVAEAEPQQAAGAHAAPAAFAPIDLLAAGPADAAPVQAPDGVWGAGLGGPAVTPVAVPADVPTAPPAPEPVPTPVLQAPAVAPVDAAELASLRAQLAVSESQRISAESRADQAVAYAQQTQARIGQLESDGQARIQGAEAKARAAANEAQDWQIRHREAEATVAELAQSVAGAESRMAELRAERDDLAAALDLATAPDQHAPTTT